MQKERSYTKEEEECEEFFQKTYQRDSNGRFIVGLPFKTDRQPLGQSRNRAIVRLNQLQNRFNRQEDFYMNYSAVIEEYKSLKHMQPIKQKENTGEIYYMPHHAVLKNCSTTTKLRVVFDASAKTTTGESLNEQLLVGPTLQQDLSSILMRWRSHKIILVADIAQMYRQIKVRDEDQ